MTNSEDILASLTQNVVSFGVIAATFRWTALLPEPERVVEWSLGLLVAISILTYNIIRIIQAIRRKKKQQDE